MDDIGTSKRQTPHHSDLSEKAKKIRENGAMNTSRFGLKGLCNMADTCAKKLFKRYDLHKEKDTQSSTQGKKERVDGDSR